MSVFSFMKPVSMVKTVALCSALLWVQCVNGADANAAAKRISKAMKCDSMDLLEFKDKFDQGAADNAKGERVATARFGEDGFFEGLVEVIYVHENTGRWSKVVKRVTKFYWVHETAHVVFNNGIGRNVRIDFNHANTYGIFTKDRAVEYQLYCARVDGVPCQDDASKLAVAALRDSIVALNVGPANPVTALKTEIENLSLQGGAVHTLKSDAEALTTAIGQLTASIPQADSFAAITAAAEQINQIQAGVNTFSQNAANIATTAAQAMQGLNTLNAFVQNVENERTALAGVVNDLRTQIQQQGNVISHWNSATYTIVAINGVALLLIFVIVIAIVYMGLGATSKRSSKSERNGQRGERQGPGPRHRRADYNYNRGQRPNRNRHNPNARAKSGKQMAEP